jgi:hypothetical protein
LRHQNGKLIAAEAGHRVWITRTATKPIGYQTKQLVPDWMAQRIVYGFKVVEIEGEHGNAFTALHALQLLRQALSQKRTIWQIGQRIVMRHMGDLLFGTPPFSHILVGHQSADARYVSGRDQMKPASRDLQQLVFAGVARVETCGITLDKFFIPPE